MDIYSAFTSERAKEKFLASVPDSEVKQKFSKASLIPVVITTKQITALTEHYRKLIASDNSALYMTHLAKHGIGAYKGPKKFMITSLWALEQDVALFKKLGVPFPIMTKWYNDTDEIELLKSFVELRVFHIEDVHEYIHYSNVYLTENLAYALHFKGD